MTPLTGREQAFIEKMKKSEELARHGFTLLSKRQDFVRFFDKLYEAGLFDGERNPAPIPAQEEGYVRVPYWGALDYLVAVAKLSGEQNDLPLADKVMSVVRTVSRWRGGDGESRANHNTSRKFTEILGLVPTASVTTDDIDMIPMWLNDRFDRMLVSSTLDEKVLPRFLASTALEDWDKAVAIFHHCTAVEWTHKEGLDDQSPSTVVEEYWLQRLISNHANELGAKRGTKAAPLLTDRVREVFASDLHREHSSIYRAAIEDHHQNHAFRSAENNMVVALRDVLLGWAPHDMTAAKEFVRTLLADDSQILRRIGIYVLGNQWAGMKELYLPFLKTNAFAEGHLHELYVLLSERFAEFTDAEKEATVHAVSDLPAPAVARDSELALKRQQQRWLTAITGKGYALADSLLADLSADPSVGPSPPNPDFTSFRSSWSGPGASPYSVAELIGYASTGVLSDRLNAFQERDRWQGPTLDGLVSALQDAARTAPEVFAEVLSNLLNAKPRFQNSVIMGLQQAWDAKEPKAQVEWNLVWERMVSFSEKLLADTHAGEDAEGHHDWVLAAIANCLRAGVQDDSHAYPEELLPRAQALIALLLRNAPAATDPSNDPMTASINTPKGRAVEALFSHALRTCRVNDKKEQGHKEAWQAVQPLFDAELNACRDGNFEFSTLCAGYLAQLEYLSAEWTTANIKQIFPPDFPANEKCAIAGLAYASFTKGVYDNLLKVGVVERALRYELPGRETRAKLLERIAAAYVWGLETLDSPRFKYLFTNAPSKDLEQVAWVLATIRGTPLTSEQKERVLQFWERCIVWSRTTASPPTRLMSSLSALTFSLESADGRERGLLLSVAPYVHVGHNAYQFHEQLLRLAEVSPDGVITVMEAMVAANVPDFDYEDHLAKLLRLLVKKRKKIEVVRLLDRLRTLPGMQELFNELTGNAA